MSKDSKFMLALAALAFSLVMIIAAFAVPFAPHNDPVEQTRVVPMEEGFTFELPATITVTVTPKRIASSAPKAKAMPRRGEQVKHFVCDGIWHDSQYDEQTYQRCEWL